MLLRLACGFLLLIAAARATEPPTSAAPVPGEAERINALIEELTQLKAQVAAVEERLETLLRSLSEQRGALQNRPAFDVLKQQTLQTAPDVPDRKPPVVRCAAITNSGKRCSRAAVPGSRYCRQHQLANQK
ncbi:MAG: hypothetical protein N2036_05790 [Bryobacteraceae bacterium]|nr:hypothetical protein [Bryobacteraceae bacterium]MCX7603570.1 hypothetical protein [Bryobacteraceae bacterium]